VRDNAAQYGRQRRSADNCRKDACRGLLIQLLYQRGPNLVFDREIPLLTDIFDKLAG